MFEYNQTLPSHAERRRELLEAILGDVGERTILLPPFHAGPSLSALQLALSAQSQMKT